jgi:hypothetical protein
LPELLAAYSGWKSQGIEVVYISLDEPKEDFKKFAYDRPFLSNCDFQKFKSRAVVDYYVFGRPSYFILKKNRKILLRPQLVKQIEDWVDCFLVKGNPISP